MAESKFSGIFDKAVVPEPEPPERAEKQARKPAKEPSRYAGPGRPPGKASNPEWEQSNRCGCGTYESGARLWMMPAVLG
jgi:hypothetical protein